VPLALVFGRDDPARVRFAVSPLWETTAALRVLREPRRRRYHLPWLDLVRPDLDRLDLSPLMVLSPHTGWTPDFLTPAPAGPGTDIADQLAQIRATAPHQVALEVRRSLTERSGEPAPEAAWRLLDDPVATRGVLADLLEQCWQLLIAPHWPRLRDLLQADVRYRTQRLGDYGLEHMLESLAEPASTHTLARRHGLAPSTVSEHLAALHGARLVTRQRHRHDVLYQQAPLGAELASGGPQP